MSSFTISQNQHTIAVHTHEITLAFSCDDGGLRMLQHAGGSNVLGYGKARPSIDIQLDDRGWLAERTFVRYLGHTVDEREGGVEIVIVIGIGPLKVYDRYRITGTLIARRVSVENVGEDEVQLCGVRLALPWARVGAIETCRFDAPANSVRPHVPLTVAAAQRQDVLPRRFFAPGLRDGRAMEPAPTQGPGLLALHNSEIDEVLFCWYYSTVEPALPQIEGNNTAVTLAHEIALSDWLGSEVALSGGTQYIMLLRETWAAALTALQRTWPICGFRQLANPAAWVRDAAIYEVHPSQFGGLQALTAALPDLCALGLNTICLMPIWAFANHKQRLWDGNWDASGSPYAIRDFEQLDPTLGTPEDLRALVDTAHRCGMRVLIDLPMEGCADDSRYLAEHAEWFCYDEQNRLVRPPGQNTIVSFDWANPALHDFMLAWARELVRTFDFDGYRVVVPRAGQPNWARKLSYHAGASSMGVLRLLERLQYELKAIKGDAALFGELSGPVYESNTDVTFDELSHLMFVHLALNRLTPAELGEWLEDHVRTLPPGRVRVCFTESHQTHILNPLADGLHGSRISRMLLAGMVFCGFVPMIWFGQESDDRSFVERLLHARHRHPALRHGRVLYNALPCSSQQVFAILREYEGEQLVGLLNVGPHKQTVAVSLPVDTLGLIEGDYELHNLLDQNLWVEGDRRSWHRDELLALRLTLEPFGAYCFAIRVSVPRPAAADADQSAALADAPGQAEADANDQVPMTVAVGEAVPMAATNGRRQGKRKRELE
jgi:glycosidase